LALLSKIILSSALTFIAIPVTAQVAVTTGSRPDPLACTASAPNVPTLRAESMTERSVDLVVTCTGGQAIPPGSPIPTADFTVSFGTNATSRILLAPNISEALLLIDEPGASGTLPVPVPGYGPAAAQLACNNYTVAAATGGCVQYGFTTANGVPIASSSPDQLTPPANVFFGAVAANQVVFHGIPVLAPVTAGIARVFRMTNLRANVSGLGGGALAGVPQLLAAIQVNGSSAIPISNPVQIAGFFQNYFQSGLSSTVLNAGGTAPLSSTEGGLLSPFVQGPQRIAVLEFSENFGGAFKPRGAGQNIPGADYYGTESGFVFTGSGGFNGKVPGLADYGTRMKAMFHNIPPGVRLWVPASNLPETPMSDTNTLAVLVTGEADLYVDGSVPAVTVTTTAGVSTPLAELPIVNGTATAVWEVISADPAAMEKFNFPLFAGYSGAGTGTAVVSMSLAPTYSPDLSPTQASASLPLPRFADNSVASAILTVGSSACQYSPSPDRTGFGASPGTGTVTVQTRPECLWSATSDFSWIHVGSYAGAGSNAANFSVDENPSTDSRVAWIWVAGQRIPIGQSGVAAPDLNAGSFVDPWTGTQGIAPGAWVSIYGSHLASTTQQWSPQPNGKLSTTLGGVTVGIDGIAAPLAFVSPNLINALVPAGVHRGQVSVVVQADGLDSEPIVVTSRQFLPAIYSVRVTAVPPHYYVTAVDPATGQLVGNAAVDSRVARAARPGDMIDLYAIGLGPTVPAFPTDTFFNGSYAVASPFTVEFGSATIVPSFAALTAPGLYQVRITIPPDTPAGDQPVRVDFGTAQSAAGVYLTVQP